MENFIKTKRDENFQKLFSPLLLQHDAEEMMVKSDGSNLRWYFYRLMMSRRV